MKYTTARYLELLQTHSDHIVLTDAKRRALLDAVASVIDRHGGTLMVEYVTELWLTRVADRQG